MALMVPIICGLISMIGVHCFSELGSMIPESAGKYTYSNLTFGTFFGFVRFWSFCILSVPLSQFLRAYEFGKLITIGITELLKQFEARRFIGPSPHCNPHQSIWPTWMVMLNVILLVAFINCYNSNVTRIIQDIFTAFSILDLIVIFVANDTYTWFGG